MDTYSIYAIEYERRQAVTTDLFLRHPEQKPVSMSYFIWAITGSNGTVVVDTGYTKETALSRGRDLKRNVDEGLNLIGINPSDAAHVVITHFHWDHLGNLELFPKATFFAQEKEMAFWTGRYANHPIFRDVIETDDINRIVRLNLEGRLVLVNGSREIFPGITLYLVGGHTSGMQILEVATSKGTAVIASDAVKTYRNLAENIPDPFLHDIPEMIDGYELVRKLATNESLIFPGHDPDVLNRFKLVAQDVVVLD